MISDIKVTVSAILLLGSSGCATTSSSRIPMTALQTYSAGDIVTGGERAARIKMQDGCLYVVVNGREQVAFFPTGTKVVAGGEGIQLPDGPILKLGATNPLLLEYFPVLENANPSCKGQNAFVRSVASTGD